MQDFFNIDNPFVGPEESAAEPDLSDRRSPKSQVYSVTELTRRISALFEEAFAYGVWVEGELSEPKAYPSGHLWFSLKDSQSTVKSVMWRDDARVLRFNPEQGLKVICYGKVDFYAPRGEVKFVVRSMEPKGIGALQLAFEQLKEKLQKEGLFAEERKRPLPLFPERVGLVTSPRGAAVDDMLKVLRGQVELFLYPTRVQGGAAAEAIAAGVRQMNRMEMLDLLIVGRGGGSLEDLWAFNEEPVARAIAESRLPVISAVGHEKDVTISDLVADLRAATPTKGAEMVLAQRRVAVDRLAALLEEPAFTEPEEWIRQRQEKLEALEETMLEALREPLLEGCHALQVLQGALMACSPQSVILHRAGQLHAMRTALHSAVLHALDRLAGRFLGKVGQLHALSPLGVLRRGYSITFDPAGNILREARSVKAGDSIETRLHRGKVRSRVESTMGANLGRLTNQGRARHCEVP